jgi:hypothetical protein
MRTAALDLGEQNKRRGQKKRAIEGMQGKRARVGHGKSDLCEIEDQCQTRPPAEAA